MAWSTLVLLAVVGVTTLAGMSWLNRTVLKELPSDLSDYREWRPLTNCRIYDVSGTEVDRFFIEKRVWVDIDGLSDTTWQAFVAAEDRRFFEHPGVDFLGIVRAMMVNLQAGSVVQGGSTLTQQLVKNILVGKEKSYERKIKEAVLAWRLEKELSKMEILELYLNYVYLGSGNYGVEAAAQDYFGRSAAELDPGMAAMIAGLIPAPSRYSPRVQPEQAAARRAIVLTGMVEQGFLTREQADSFLEDPVSIPRRDSAPSGTGAAYFTAVRHQVRRLMGDELLFSEGVQVYTPLNMGIQAAAEEAVRAAVRGVETRQGVRGPVGHLSPKARDGWLAEAAGLARGPDGKPAIPEPGTCFRALVLSDLDHLGVADAVWPLGEAAKAAQIHTETGPRPIAEAVTAGDLLQVCLAEDQKLTLDPDPWPEGAAVILENSTGRVIALVGGYEPVLEGFLRATQARRQPGSSFKPYVYGAALMAGHTQLDTVIDGPISLPAGGGRVWSPKNYSEGYAGPLPMRTALAKSLNTVAVRLAMEVGPAEIARLAKALGVRTRLRTDLTIALGSSEMTPMDQALGYAAIANLGVPVESVFVDRMVDVLGREIGKAGEKVIIDGREIVKLPGGPQPRAMPAGVAYELVDMLREVVRAGTAKKAWKEGLDRAGKTGTTNAYNDAWFVGFTPRYTVAVWVGTDGTRPLGEDETGGRAALPAWIKIVEALPQPPEERIQPPDEALLVPWNGMWVALARGHIPAKVFSSPDPGEAPLPEWPSWL